MTTLYIPTQHWEHTDRRHINYYTLARKIYKNLHSAWNTNIQTDRRQNNAI